MVDSQALLIGVAALMLGSTGEREGARDVRDRVLPAMAAEQVSMGVPCGACAWRLDPTYNFWSHQFPDGISYFVCGTDGGCHSYWAAETCSYYHDDCGHSHDDDGTNVSHDGELRILDAAVNNTSPTSVLSLLENTHYKVAYNDARSALQVFNCQGNVIAQANISRSALAGMSQLLAAREWQGGAGR